MSPPEIFKPYTNTERQNTKLILAAIKKYIEESFRDPRANNIVDEMCIINQEMDKVRARNIFNSLRGRLVSEGVIAEIPSTTESGVAIMKYHILKNERLWQ